MLNGTDHCTNVGTENFVLNVQCTRILGNLSQHFNTQTNIYVPKISMINRTSNLGRTHFIKFGFIVQIHDGLLRSSFAVTQGK